MTKGQLGLRSLINFGMAGLAAGLYSGITYGMKEARGGAHDWVSEMNIIVVTLETNYVTIILNVIYVFFNYICNRIYLQRNSAVAGALTGAAMAMTSERTSHEQVVQSALTGAALSTAANLLSGVF